MKKFVTLELINGKIFSLTPRTTQFSLNDVGLNFDAFLARRVRKVLINLNSRCTRASPERVQLLLVQHRPNACLAIRRSGHFSTNADIFMRAGVTLRF